MLWMRGAQEGSRWSLLGTETGDWAAGEDGAERARSGAMHRGE